MSNVRGATLAACRVLLILGPLLGLASRSQPRYAPAVIVNPGSASRMELARIVREALHGAPVTLADDALTTSNLLIIERAAARDAGGRPLNGRRMSVPEKFELSMHKSRCMLVQTRTGRRWTLRHTDCLAIKSSPPPDVR